MILINIEMPEKCNNDCPFFLGCDNPDKFPFVECKLIGNLGSMFNQTARPINCPLEEYTATDPETENEGGELVFNSGCPFEDKTQCTYYKQDLCGKCVYNNP